MLETVLLVLHVLVAFGLIGVILLQHGKGASMGAAFGSGASATVFGARGSANFLTRTTTVLAIIFFSNSILLSYLYSQKTVPKSLMERVEAPAAPAAPATAPAEPEAPTVPAERTVPAVPAPSTAPAAEIPQVPGDSARVPAVAPPAPELPAPVPQVPAN